MKIIPSPLMIKGRDIMMMNRRTFSTALLAGAAASLISTRGMAANATPPKARNVALVHGLLDRGECAIAGGSAQLELGAEPTDELAGSLCLGSARSGPARRPNGLRRTFLLWNDPHGGRRAREGFGPGICRGPGAGCGRGLYGIGQDLPDSAGERRNRLRWRRGAAHRSRLP